MFDIWQENVEANFKLINDNKGPAFVIVVSGSELEQSYWQNQFRVSASDVFRRDASTHVHSTLEAVKKGNFLGTINAWLDGKSSLKEHNIELPKVVLMSMVFGQGKRLSPFTQAMGNRKSAIRTPAKSRYNDTYLSVADLSNRYSNLWLEHLETNGFHGLIVKWGDEAVIPGINWNLQSRNFVDLDAIRFVWKTEITPDLAHEKEWIVINSDTNLMEAQLSRQPYASLKQRINELGSEDRILDYGVNLGSLAISYPFLDIAADVLKSDLVDPTLWVDWDPYVWIALTCKDANEWRAEANREQRNGITGIAQLEQRYPDFYNKIALIRYKLEAHMGRPLAIGIIDFGEAYWLDMGLHLSFRKKLQSSIEQSMETKVIRKILGIPDLRDDNGNTIIRSSIPKEANIQDSIIIDTIIQDPRSIAKESMIVGGRHNYLDMRHGGYALFCAINNLIFHGSNALAYRSIADNVELPQGGRHTTLLDATQLVSLVSNEDGIDYKGEGFHKRILGNPISFEDASKLVAELDPIEMEQRWKELWENWLE